MQAHMSYNNQNNNDYHNNVYGYKTVLCVHHFYRK